MTGKWKTLLGTVTVGATLLAASVTPIETEAASTDKAYESTFNKQITSTIPLEDEQEVQAFLNKKKAQLDIGEPVELKFVTKETDEVGMTHYTFQPTLEEVPLDGAKLMVHTDGDDHLIAVNGALHTDSPRQASNTKVVSSEIAKEAAWNSIDVTRDATDESLTSPIGEVTETLKESSQLVVMVQDGDYKLAHHIQLQFTTPYPANYQIWVDAETGDILKKMNKVHEATGSGTGVLGDTKELKTYQSNGTYYLYDTSKPMTGVIETFDNNQNGQFRLPGSYVTDRDNAFTSSRQRAAVDAHYYAGQVFDYFYDTFGRVSYDDNGATIRSSVHYGSNYNNAAWVGTQMIYGDGDGSTFTALSGADDIVAHELTHAVTDESADLIYENQSGALNESFSDVFGYFVDNEDWLMGEDVYTPGVPGDALRSLSNPTKYDQPAHMDQYRNLPNTEAGDYGGVHINSGIPNKAAYVTIQSIGQTKAEQIYYRALTSYLTPTSTFQEAKEALVQSAKDLYGSAEANAVTTAWNDVGVQ
ncbi:peptidase M4 [Pontibacillus halophilus JSM 076056 = DSM 19796]|uniref:Neutral metalloproteinase n=1 Tax=Pontibacillus halophilus JSM 076056 = DSM 19796 TaxID=1385510 RepID=A0A0A5GII0_9BACI|nr:M4 family metallopeptidase [Pontibacillus halophilus]KGX90940.1 peptidase M4 [Pontibacillus halophilus JSM 076056 = DSM 19796]